MPKHRVYTKELLEQPVKDSFSVAQVCRKIGVRDDGSMSSLIKRKILLFKIDISHFKGQGANFGIYHKGGVKPRNYKQILVLRTDGKRDTRRMLHRALQESGREYTCEECKLKPIWNDKKLVIQIDHINENPSDNRSKNLRYLCPNCHTQTDTFTSKNMNNANVVER